MHGLDEQGEQMPAPRPGYEFVFLLAQSFRSVVDALHQHLASQGHPGARPGHGFALQAIGPDGVTISELGRRLGVSKQAAAKTVSGLVALGYIAREPDPADSRASRIRRTSSGDEVLALSAAFFEQEQARLVAEVGHERFAACVAVLETMGAGSSLADFPGWLQP